MSLPETRVERGFGLGCCFVAVVLLLLFVLFLFVVLFWANGGVI